MSFLMSLIPAAIVLGILITIHEYGHFLACRFTGVKVEKFSIGFGPEILHWQGKETCYTIALLPLGGFVKPAGESISEVEGEEPKEGDYLHASVWARILIVCAGVIMNYVLAFVLFTVIGLMGKPVPGTTIGGFVENYPAISSGLQENDRIVQIDNTEVQTWHELTTYLDQSSGKPVSLLIDREGALKNITVQPKVEKVFDVFGKEVMVTRLGIRPHPEAKIFEKYGFLEALKSAWETEVFLTVMTHKAIIYLMMGKMSMDSLSGPIGIVNMTGEAAQLGLPYLLNLMAVLSVSLAVINLFPIPALDGGHLFFLIIEVIRRKRVSLAVQEKATTVGFFALLGLMGFIIYSDLVKVNFFGKIASFFGG